MAAPTPTEDLARKALDSMANAAVTLRKAISASLPVSSTQLMTIQVPGSIIDPKPYVWDPDKDPFMPLKQRIAEARLVDNQVPISQIMMGRSGKSVARSYMSTLDCLMSVENSIASALAGSKALNPREAQIKQRYDTAMDYLTSEDPRRKGHTRVETYVAKQDEWNKAVEKYNEAQFKQKNQNRELGLTIDRQQQVFLEWMQLNGRDYKATIQAKYMDWVVHGYKFNVEFYFGVVDVSSAMKRIESSKEAFRNLTLLDEDGASEYAGVRLNPPNWATLVKETIDNWGKINKGPSPLEVRAEIKRLTNLRLSHQAMLESVRDERFVPHTYSEVLPDGDNKHKAKYAETYEKLNKAEDDALEKEKKESDGPDKKENGFITKGLVQLDPSIFKDMEAEHKEWNEDHIKQNARVIRDNSKEAREATISYLAGRVQVIDTEIKELQGIMDANSPAPAAKSVVNAQPIDEKGRAITADDLKANKELKSSPDLSQKPSPWTRITAKVSKSESASSQFTSESSTSGGGDAGWWFWSASASGGTSESSASATSSTSNLEIEVSMDCMLVEIERPWMHAELFADHELDAAPGFKISPGAQALQEAAEKNKQVDTDYTMFSSYPNAFIIACNVELSFSGDTTHLETAIEASSTEANVSVGIGPFTISSSHKSSKSSNKTKAESTATGMRISMQAPQIIAWVQELLPALPKSEKGNPALFGLPLSNVPPKPLPFLSGQVEQPQVSGKTAS